MFASTKKSARATKFKSVQIETRILDGASRSSVCVLKCGAAYGHIVEIGKFLGLYALPISIKSSLPDTLQLSFQAAESNSCAWEWNTVLHPDRSAGENSEILICRDAKVRDTDMLKVSIEGYDIKEDLKLEVEIAK